MNEKQPAVYIMTNKRNGTLYVGVTSNLIGRCWQHRNRQCKGFTAKYDCDKLVYFECHGDMYAAISREKQLKGASRKKKLALIEAVNPDWLDLYTTIT